MLGQERESKKIDLYKFKRLKNPGFFLNCVNSNISTFLGTSPELANVELQLLTEAAVQHLQLVAGLQQLLNTHHKFIKKKSNTRIREL